MVKYRLCFAGTPAFAAAHLSALLETEHEIVAVFTQPDRRAGRGNKLQASAVKQLAVNNDLPVHQPQSLRGDEPRQLLTELAPDLLIVVAYGLILPQEILDIPRLGCINVHASLLPRWRGAAPIERALLAGDKVTGVTIMKMDAGLDTGDILYQSEVTIEDTDTREEVEAKLEACGQAALRHSLEHMETLLATATAQPESGVTYAEKLEKSEALVNWRHTAEQVNRVIRAGIGRVPAYTLLDKERIRLLHAVVTGQAADAAPGTVTGIQKDGFLVACGDSQLKVDKVQLPGKNPVSVGELVNSRPELFAPGTVFASESGEPS